MPRISESRPRLCYNQRSYPHMRLWSRDRLRTMVQERQAERLESPLHEAAGGFAQHDIQANGQHWWALLNGIE